MKKYFVIFSLLLFGFLGIGVVGCQDKGALAKVPANPLEKFSEEEINAGLSHINAQMSFTLFSVQGDLDRELYSPRGPIFVSADGKEVTSFVSRDRRTGKVDMVIFSFPNSNKIKAQGTFYSDSKAVHTFEKKGEYIGKDFKTEIEEYKGVFTSVPYAASEKILKSDLGEIVVVYRDFFEGEHTVKFVRQPGDFSSILLDLSPEQLDPFYYQDTLRERVKEVALKTLRDTEFINTELLQVLADILIEKTISGDKVW
jgi:hypothetical protein